MFNYPIVQKIQDLGTGVLVVCLLICLILISLLIYFFIKRDVPSPVSTRYLDPTLPIEERIDDLLSQMTLEEKIGQMALVEKDSLAETHDISRYGLGAILSGGGSKPTPNTTENWRLMVDAFVQESHNSRFQIPILYGVDAIHGHSNVSEATIFPHFIGLGATGDEALVEAIARATAAELTTTGVYWNYSPTLDIPSDIRGGRVYETFSDDPSLVGKLGAAYVRGLQDNGLNQDEQINVLATLKHYIGAGSMNWESSSNENFIIDQGETTIDESTLREIHLPPFKKSIDAGALSIMVGLNSWSGTKMSAEKYLITDVLKNELGFKGFVVSDWYGIYEISDNHFNDAVTAINAGVDMVMLPFDYKPFIKNVSAAVEQGLIPEERIDDAVSRILYAKFSTGLFEKASSMNPDATLGNSEHRMIAREAVAKSLVLLKDNQNLLPIKDTVDHIRVAGSAADNTGKQAGGGQSNGKV